MKYIPAEKLIAEIERLDEKYRTIRVNGKLPEAREADLVIKVLRNLSIIITSLQQEQPEVDLEKIKNLIRAALNGVTRLGSLCDDQTIEHAVDNLIDKLGLNARKEESK